MENRDDKLITVIVNETCNFFDVIPSDVFSKTRKDPLKTARQIIQYLCNKHTKKSLEQIGKISLVYGREKPHTHASILHSKKNVENLMSVETSFFNNVKRIELNVRSKVGALKNINTKEINIVEQKNHLELLLIKKEAKIEELQNKINNKFLDKATNKYYKELFSLSEDIINDFSKTRLEPYLKMIKK